MSGIFAHAWLLVACLYIVRSAAGPTDVLRSVSTKECESHDQCPANRACEEFQCVDPCVDLCSVNSECLVHQHIPFCGCNSGYVGNAFSECFKKDPLKKSYFIEGTERMNFNKSIEYCESMGMRLGTFNNEAEFKQLAESIGSKGYVYVGYWLAGSDLAERDVWRWQTTGREMAYLPWGWYDPDHAWDGSEEQHCVAVYSYSSASSAYIFDWYCSFPLRPICEY